MHLKFGVRALKSLKLFVLSNPKKNNVDKCDKASKKMLKTGEHVQSRTRKKSVKLNPLEYVKPQDTNLSPRENFNVSDFIPVIDQLCLYFTERLHAFNAVCLKFGLFNHLEEMDGANMYTAAEKSVKLYTDYFKPSFGNKFVQIVFLIDLCKKDYKKTNLRRYFTMAFLKIKILELLSLN